MKLLFTTALLSSVALSGAAMAQSQCDQLVTYFKQNNVAQANTDFTQARKLQADRNEAECTTMLQRVNQSGQAAQQNNGQQAEGANIVVQQPAPTITVDQAQPQISVQQAAPTVSVRQP